jgi:hypothetical protein
MTHPKRRGMSYVLLDELKDCIMSMRTTLSERAVMTLIADKLLQEGQDEILSIYNNIYCNGDYEGVVNAFVE